jgi:hypothetical protein
VAKKKKVTRKAKPSFALGKVYMEKDLRVYEQKLPDCEVNSKRVIGIDLGSNCGVTMCDFNLDRDDLTNPFIMGQWDLNLGPYDTGPMRFIRMKQYLAIAKPDLVMYEDVKYTPSKEGFGFKKNMAAIVARVANASEMLGGLKVVLTSWCEERGIPAQGISIQHIKKYATGVGNANKKDMIKAGNARFGTNFDPETYEQTGADNIMDSAFCCLMGVELYGEGLTDD